MPARHHIATLLLLSSTAAYAGSEPHAPPDRSKVTPEVQKLRDELFALKRDAVMKVLPRFRALCDAEGYPLVGNLATKGDDGRVQPSEVCRRLREQPKSKS